MVLRLLVSVCTVLSFLTVFCTENPVSERKQEVTPKTVAEVDSLFDLLVTRVESMERLDSADSYESGRSIIVTTDFTSLSSEFAIAVAADPNDVKANVGYIVSSVMALNKSSTMLQLADSIDAYFEAVDEYYWSEPVNPEFIEGNLVKKGVETPLKKTKKYTPGMITKAFLGGGARGMGTALLAKAPALLKASGQMQPPAFPRFLTIDHIQNIVEDEIVPVLDSVVEALVRLENLDNVSLTLVADGERVDLDKSDIYVFDAGVRLLRGCLEWFLIYDMDLYTSESDQSYSWIDQMIEAEENSDYTDTMIYRVSNDTLYEENRYFGGAYTERIMKVIRDNFKRSSFMKIRRANHAAVYQDLLAAPQLIQSGIASLRAEDPDDQEYDLIPQSVLLEDIDEEMLSFREDMIDEGFTPALADRFQTPEALMGLIEEILNGPFTFNETVDDDVVINLTVDLSAYFKNPVEDLRTLIPKYRLLEDGEMKQSWTSYHYIEDQSAWAPVTVYIYTDDDWSVYINAIESQYISSISESTYSTRVTLQSTVIYRAYSSVTTTYVPFVFTDDAGNDISFEEIENQIDAGTYFPYFTDYTFHGVFPGMTRQKWLDLLWQ